MAHVAEIDNIIQPEAKIWNRLVVFFQKVSCQVICEEHSPNRFTALLYWQRKLNDARLNVAQPTANNATMSMTLPLLASKCFSILTSIHNSA